MDLISTWDILHKWVMFFTIVIVPGILILMSMLEEKEEEFIDVPEFIKGNASDFYGN